MPENKVTLWRMAISAGQIVVDEILPGAAIASLDAAAACLPGGAYTTLRTYQHNKTLHLEGHLLRLEETARLAGRPIILDRQSWRQALRTVLTAYAASQEVRLRLLVDLQGEPGAAYLISEPLVTPPAEAYSYGVLATTCQFVRQNPKAKLTTTMTGAVSIRQNLPAGANEALMLDEGGRILEGLSSNFFAVKNGVLWTAEEGVLSGITRQLVLEEALRAEVPLHLEGLPLGDLPTVQEAFITSTSRAVLPVRQVDDLVIANGQPGPITIFLAQRYAERILQDIETI
jgi:branched-chain amino acid aminotransferase